MVETGIKCNHTCCLPPIELLYDKEVRGLLDVLKESWSTDKNRDTNIISYVLLMRQKLSKISYQAQTNLEEARC